MEAIEAYRGGQAAVPKNRIQLSPLRASHCGEDEPVGFAHDQAIYLILDDAIGKVRVPVVMQSNSTYRILAKAEDALLGISGLDQTFRPPAALF